MAALKIDFSKIMKPYLGQKLLLGCSGGLDSMALLLLACHLRDHFGALVEVAHIHHGAGSPAQVKFRDRAREFVRQSCSRRNLVFWTNPQPPATTLVGEGAMRDFRRSELARLAQDCGAPWVVLAHHQQDQLETQLLQMIRGSGKMGAGGMVLEKGIYLRPLLTVPRADLRAFLQAESQSWVEDPSNQDMQGLRSWLRCQWLPQLEARRPGSLKTLARSVENLSNLELAPDLSDFMVGPALCLDQFLKLSRGEQTQILAQFMSVSGLRGYGRSHILELLKRLDSPQKELTFTMLRHQWVLDAGHLSVVRATEIEPGAGK